MSQVPRTLLDKYKRSVNLMSDKALSDTHVDCKSDLLNVNEKISSASCNIYLLLRQKFNFIFYLFSCLKLYYSFSVVKMEELKNNCQN